MELRAQGLTGERLRKKGSGMTPGAPKQLGGTTESGREWRRVGWHILSTNVCIPLDICGPTYVVSEGGFALGKTLLPSALTHPLPNMCGRLRACAWMEHVVGGRAGVLSPGRPDIGEVSQERERSRAMAGPGPHTEW